MFQHDDPKRRGTRNHLFSVCISKRLANSEPYLQPGMVGIDVEITITEPVEQRDLAERNLLALLCSELRGGKIRERFKQGAPNGNV